MGYELSEIFPDVQVRLLTAIEIHVTYPTPPDGVQTEYMIGEIEPTGSRKDIEERFGDGSYRVVGVGTERGDNGAIRRIVRDVVTIRIACGKPPTWIERLEETIRRQSPDAFPKKDGPDLFPGRPGDPSGRPFHGFDQGSSLPDPFGYGPSGFGGMPSVGSSPSPMVIPIGDGENLVMSHGLSPEEQQRRIDQAMAQKTERKEASKMSDFLVQMMQMQLQQAQQAAKESAARAEQNNERLFSILVNGTASKPADSGASDVQLSSLREMNESLRRQLRDMDDQHRRDRQSHWDDLDQMKKRHSELEDILRMERRKNEELTAKLAKADIDAMLAGKAPGASLSDEEKLQRKMAMFAQLAQSLAPAVMPILEKTGILGSMMGGGQAPAPAIPSGDLPLTGGSFDGGQGGQPQ